MEQIRFMEEILPTCWYGKYPIIYKVLYIPGGVGFLPSTVCLSIYNTKNCKELFRSEKGSEHDLEWHDSSWFTTRLYCEYVFKKMLNQKNWYIAALYCMYWHSSQFLYIDRVCIHAFISIIIHILDISTWIQKSKDIDMNLWTCILT